MKRGLIFIIIFMFFFLILVSLVSPTVFGIIISGKATAPTNVSISITNIGPMINIFSPKENRTYKNESIFLNYSVYDPDNISLVWYNLDNGNNISLGSDASSSTTFNTSEDNHTLYLYANDTLNGINFSSVDFFVNNTKIIVVYENFRGDKKGSSTDFDSLTDEQLENLSNMVLEHTDYGKILWNEAINITDDKNPSDKITISDQNVIITTNSIFVNETALPNLNKKATLWFYNLTFTNPRVLRNGFVCPASICTNKIYSNGILKVDVTGFTNYSVGETPPEVPGAPGGGGGGGREREKVKEENFVLHKGTIRVSLKQGETKIEYLQIKNIGKKDLKITIESFGIEDFVKISEKDFELSVGETKTIVLDFIAREKTLPDLYMGKILVKGDDTLKEVLVAIEIISKKPLFDVKVEILPEFIEVEPGQNVMAQVTLYNLGKESRVDVDVEYIIKDKEGNQIVSEHEMISVATSVSFVKRLRIPKDIELGTYVFYVRATYNGIVGSGSAFFNVIKISLSQKIFKLENIIVFIILLIFAIVVVYELRKIRGLLHKYEKISEEKIITTKRRR